MPVDISLPPVPGDPAGMRALAAVLRSDAAALATIAAETAATLDGLEFFGPAAELADAAAVLERSAGDVGPEQAARERELEQLRRELAPH
jgi:hypothetical protein